MEKVVLFAFRGEPMCFIHVLLNAMDLHARDLGGRIVLEGESVRLIPLISRTDHPLHKLFLQVRSLELIEGACRACSVKLNVSDSIQATGIPLIGDMSGHPSMASYIEKGFRIITF